MKAMMIGSSKMLCCDRAVEAVAGILCHLPLGNVLKQVGEVLSALARHISMPGRLPAQQVLQERPRRRGQQRHAPTHCSGPVTHHPQQHMAACCEHTC